ncbi:uncharacterized protein BJX67DRAFT_386614 [Aspergillus lucknowensis]|uniref:Uncharacterized protein n=1 Tax=Aspergillus lucknowensis TaxID=176173 RepID=A0ABR4L8L5_9EURO
MPIDEVKCYIPETAEKDIHHMKLRQDEQDRQKVLDWLSPIDYAHQQPFWLNDYSWIRTFDLKVSAIYP